MYLRRFLTACTLGVLAPLSASAAETGAGPRFEVERDWSGELRPRYRGLQLQEAAPSPVPAPVPQAAPKVEAMPAAKPRAKADIQGTEERPGQRERTRESDAFAWERPNWQTGDHRRDPERAWPERERREREYAEREYAERVWQVEERLARERRERLRLRRDFRPDFRDEDEVYWDDCDPDWDRC